MKIGQFCQVINEAKLGEKFPPAARRWAAVGGRVAAAHRVAAHCTSATLQTFHIFNTNLGASERKIPKQAQKMFSHFISMYNYNRLQQLQAEQAESKCRELLDFYTLFGLLGLS